MTAKEHNRTIGILFLVYLGLQIFSLLIIGAVAVIFGGVAMVEMNEKDAMPIAFMAGFFVVVIVVSALLLIPVAFAGWKMFKEKPNAKIWGIVASIIALLNIPLGTALGVYSLWFIFGEQGKQFYDNGGNMTTYAPPPPPNSWQ